MHYLRAGSPKIELPPIAWYKYPQSFFHPPEFLDFLEFQKKLGERY
jgi:hypothetical protein